jgi:hypothetical protein
MIFEQTPEKHFVFQTLSEAMEAWIELPPELREAVESPRQVLPNLWVFDIPTDPQPEPTHEVENGIDNAEIE